MNRYSTEVLATLLVATILAAGCDEPFPPETLVDRLRILAVKVEPPEVDVYETVDLSALVADPNGGGRALAFIWAVCMFEFTDAASDIPCPGPDSYAIPGDGPEATLSMPGLIAWLAEQGFDLDLGEGQVPVDDIPMLIGLQVDADDESLRAVKRIKVRLQGDEPPNTNPVLAGLELEDETIGDDPRTLEVGAKYTLEPLVAEGSRDLFLPEGEEDERLEDHLFSWFATTGDFSDQRTILDVDSHGNPLQDNEWKLGDEYGDHTLWLVVRDGRYGVDWLEYTFRIEP